jgi:uncharacterized membrane protein YoaK (UPF0700 family)
MRWPSDDVRDALVILLALAGYVVGVYVASRAVRSQGALVHRLGLGGVTTTYVTGTLTGFLGELATSSGSDRAQRLSMVLALFVGAAVAALLVSQARETAALLPPALTVSAVLLAVRAFGRPGRALGEHG